MRRGQPVTVWWASICGNEKRRFFEEVVVRGYVVPVGAKVKFVSNGVGLRGRGGWEDTLDGDVE